MSQLQARQKAQQQEFDNHYRHRFLTEAEVAKDLGITIPVLHQWVSDKRIKAINKEGKMVFRMVDVQNFLLSDEFY